MNKLCIFILYLLPGTTLSLLGVFLGWFFFPNFIRDQVIQKVQIIQGSETWYKWKEAPIPIYLTFYIHHITNPDEVENGMQAVFQEKGPYTYLQKRVKVDIRQDDGLNTIKYREVKTYFFDRKMSGKNSEEDLVNIPNLPFIAVIDTVRKMLPLELVVGMVGNIILNDERLIRRNVSVGDLLFRGFDVTKYTNSLLASQLPSEFSGGRFGLYKGQNGTAAEEWEVFTGYENAADFGRVKTWDGRRDLGYWRKFSDCDRIQGTDGTVFQPFITKDTILYVYSTDICRSLPLIFQQEIEHLGISGYRFETDPAALGDARIHSETLCYCLEENLDNCPYAGLLHLDSCKKAPIWTSTPYFLDGDIRYVVDSGLDNPIREKHETFIDVEPTTGLLLKAHKRLQIGVEAQHSRQVAALRGLRKYKILLPVIWADESAELDKALADDLKSQLITPLKIVGIVKWAMVFLGVMGLVFGFFLFMTRHYLSHEADKINEFAHLQNQPVAQPQPQPNVNPESVSSSSSSLSTIDSSPTVSVVVKSRSENEDDQNEKPRKHIQV